MIEWSRLSDHEDFDDVSMWGSNSVDPDDSTQGYIGNCWAMSSMASIGEFPSIMKNTFLTDTLNSKGVYAVNLHLLGTPITVTLDDYLPYLEDPSYRGALIYA